VCFEVRQAFPTLHAAVACLCITHNDREDISADAAADAADAADAAAADAADAAQDRCDPVEQPALAATKGREHEGQRLLSGNGVYASMYTCCLWRFLICQCHALHAVTLPQAVLQCSQFGA
jgi:hypothetical protein